MCSYKERRQTHSLLNVLKGFLILQARISSRMIENSLILIKNINLLFIFYKDANDNNVSELLYGLFPLYYMLVYNIFAVGYQRDMIGIIHTTL